jgi:hypothetical protein
MDNQPTPPNSAGSAERPPEVAPEFPATGQNEQASTQETAPVPGAAPAHVTPPPAAAPPAKLSTDEVAAAVAAAPGPAAPSGGVPTPSVAGDVDVIEPEWVDKAEDVVRAHQGDPYGEEEAVEDLQRDYLKKRYGHNVGDPNPDSNKPEGA